MTSNLEAAIARLIGTLRRAESRPVGMVRVTIRDDSREGRKGLDRIFDAFGATMREIPRVMVTDLLPAVRAGHAQNFDTEGSSGRAPWAALAEATLEERARLGFAPGPILTRTGALRAHVLNTTPRITRTGTSIEFRIEPDVNVGGVPKYRALAMGLAANRLPGRPMVTLGPASAVKATSALQRGLRAAAQRNGLR